MLIFTNLDDLNQPYSCNQWGNRHVQWGDEDAVITNDSGTTIWGWFNTGSAFPSTVYIDHTMTVYHKGTDLSNARLSAKRYLALYPDGPDAAFAQYMIGLSFFDAIVDVRRDQGSALDAVKAFRLLNLKYPKNPYKESAAQKLKISYSQLAGQEMSVGRYYMKREEYLAAINRFSIVVNEYSDSIFLVEAYYRLTEAYLALGLNNLAKEK